MHGRPVPGARLAGLVAVAASVVLGTASPAVAYTPPPSYKVVSAWLTVKETASYEAQSVQWAGDGHWHATMKEEDEDLPALPTTLRSTGTNVLIPATEILDGHEKGRSLDIGGKWENFDCNGSWGDRDEDKGESPIGLRVSAQKVKGKAMIRVSWTIPVGHVSWKCHQNQYLSFTDDLKAVSFASGHIGDARLEFRIDGDDHKTRSRGTGTLTHTVSWEGHVVLTRVKRSY